jgi:hypothetical protein
MDIPVQVSFAMYADEKKFLCFAKPPAIFR